MRAARTESPSDNQRKIPLMATDKSESSSSSELGEIRREVIEARNLVIKTDNLLKNLHAELKMVGKRQEDFQKRQWISSAAAYVLFAGLCIAGAIMISSAQSSSSDEEIARLQKKVDELQVTIDKDRGSVTALAQAQNAANEVYRMMTNLPGEERLKGIDALVKLDVTRLSGLERAALNDRAESLRKEIGAAAFERGKLAFRRNDMAAAAAELSRFIAMNPAEAELLDASYFLGTALNQLRKHQEAVVHLTRFVEGDARSKTRDYAMLLLSHSLEQSGQPEKAADVAREAIGKYPNSQFLPNLKGKLSAAKRALAGGESGTVPAGATAPAAAQ